MASLRETLKEKTVGQLLLLSLERTNKLQQLCETVASKCSDVIVADSRALGFWCGTTHVLLNISLVVFRTKMSYISVYRSLYIFVLKYKHCLLMIFHNSERRKTS